MNKSAIIILILLLFTVSLRAQQVSGKVCMEKDKSPAQFASVGLLQLPDSAIITGVITLTDGGYNFQDVKPGDYLIKVSFMGYGIVQKQINVKENDHTVVDTLFLVEAATNLQEVTVVGERLKGKELVDRTTYNIPPLVAKSATNGYELLKKIPQVNVDFQNNVTLNGSSNFIIQVDGRQRDKEFLAKLLPGDIESIEIISNPSGKYEGNIDGVINIILKKEARYGMNGNVGLNIKPINKLTYNATGSLDYSMGKITFYITGFIGGQKLNISTLTRTNFKMLDSISNANGSGKINVGYSSVNTGFDYYANDKNNISFNVSYRPIRQDIDLLSNTDLMKNNATEDKLASITGDLTKSDEVTFSLFHKKTFKKPVQEFTSETSYYIFRSNQDSKFVNKLESNGTDPIYSRKEIDHNERNYISIKLNYVQPFGMNTKLEGGYQLYYQDMDYNFTIDDIAEDNKFKYAEFRNSAYAGLTFNLKKIGFQTTLRAENSHINADSVTSPDYTCLLPSVNLQYKFSASHNLKLTYNRRINRPGIYDMNPYEKIGQNYDVSVGNPNLRPDYRDRLQLTYTWNFGSNYFSPNVYYESLSNKVSRRSELIKSPVNESFTTFSKPYNLLSGYEYGGGVNAMLWFVNINGRIYQGHYDKYQKGTFTIPERDYFSYSLTSYAYAPLDKAKKTTAFAFLQYNGVNIDAQTKTYSLAFYGLGAQKQIKDHSFGFVWLLPFSSNVDLTRTETETDYYHVRNIIGFDVAWYIQFMYSYKFNKGKNVKKIGHKVDVESDSKSQGIGL